MEERGRDRSLDQFLQGATVKMTGDLGQWEVLGKFEVRRKVGAVCRDQQPVC